MMQDFTLQDFGRVSHLKMLREVTCCLAQDLTGSQMVSRARAGDPARDAQAQTEPLPEHCAGRDFVRGVLPGGGAVPQICGRSQP